MNRPAAAALVLLLIGLLSYIAYHLHVVLTPFGLSFALAYLANPLINHFEARGLRREHVVIVLYLIIASAVSISANFFIPMVVSELSKLQDKAPMYFQNARIMLGHLQTDVAHHVPVGSQLIERWSLKMYSPWMDHLQDLPGYVLSLLPVLSLVFLVPFICFYLLTDSARITRQVIQACPSRYVEQTLHLVTEIDVSLGSYVRGIMIEAMSIGSLALLGLVVLRVDYALGLAALTAVASLIPYVGNLASMLVSVFVAVYQYRNMLIVAKVLLLYLGIRLADDMLLQPVIAKRSIHLHPLAYLLALMIGGNSFGFIGLVLAVPVACVLRALFGVLWDWFVTENPTWRGFLPEASAYRLPYL